MWLIPTPQFRWAAFASRGSLWDIAGRTSDPTRALANLLARDEMFTKQIAAEAAALQLNVIEVNGELSLDQLADRVADRLQLTTGWPQAGPEPADRGVWRPPSPGSA